MSTDYGTYIGAYLSLDTPGSIETRKTVRQCPTCEVMYRDELYCSKDGSIIVDAHITTTSVISWYNLVELFDELEEFYESFRTPECLDKCIVLSNYTKTHDSLGDCSDSQIIELSAEVITGYKLKFMSAHEDVLKVMEKLGIEYTIKVGAIGYWS